MGKIYLILKNTPRFFKKQLYFTTYRNLEIGLQGFNPGIYIPTDVKQKKKNLIFNDILKCTNESKIYMKLKLRLFLYSNLYNFNFT